MTNAIRILGLDPGLGRMGWGMIALEGTRLCHIEHGVIATRAAIAAQRTPFALGPNELVRGLPQPALAMAGSAQMVDIATPLSFGGFTRATLETFAPQLRALGGQRPRHMVPHKSRRACKENFHISGQGSVNSGQFRPP